jgi:hypothetical protein
MMLGVNVLARVALAALLVAGLAGCTGDPSPGPSEQGPPSPTCPPGTTPVNLAVPEVAQIRLNVVNASGVAGLAIPVLLELGRRGFPMLSIADAPNGDAYPEAVVVRHGPGTTGAAWFVALQFRGPVRNDFDPGRTDDTIDVILGRAFENVLTPAEANQAVAVAPSPTAPPGGCAVTG